MRAIARVVCSILLLSLPAAYCANVNGTVIVKRKLTKRKVTLEAENYQRGTPVELEADLSPNDLAFERSHVAIFLEGQLPARSAPTGAPMPAMEQKNRAFVPDLLVVPAGSAVSFPNLDPIFHNVFSLSKPKSFDLGNYSINQTRKVTFEKPGVVMVYCHLHPNMSGTIVVSPSDWATRADGEGHFSLSGVPPGRYTVVAWHKAAGFFRQEIQVSEEHDAKIEFLIPLGAINEEPAHISAHEGSHTATYR